MFLLIWYEAVYFLRSMNISLQLKKIILQVPIVKTILSDGVIIIYFTMASKQFRIYYVLAVVRNQFNRINNKVTVSVSK